MAVLKPNLVIIKIRIKQSIVPRNILSTSLKVVNGMTCILKFQLEVLVVVKIVLVGVVNGMPCILKFQLEVLVAIKIALVGVVNGMPCILKFQLEVLVVVKIVLVVDPT